MFRKNSLFMMLLAIVTLIAVAGAFTSFQRKRSSFERLDFQSHRSSGVIVIDGVDAGSEAMRIGLRPGDAIIAADGIPTAEIDGFRKTLRRAGQPVPLLVARGDTMMSLDYRAPELRVDYRYLFLTFIGFLYLAIGLFTLFRGARDESLLFFFVTLLAFIVYVYTPAGNIGRTYRILALIEEFARIFLPPLTLHFFLRFPRPLIQKRLTLAAIYAAPILVALWNINVLILDNAIPIASPALSLSFIDRWEMLHFAIYFTLAFVALTYTYRTAPAAGQRKQVKWIYFGMGVGFIPFLILYLIPFILRGAGSAYTTIAILPLAFIPLAFAVSILKYKLWDVEVIIKEILAYTVTFIFGMIAFTTVNLLLSKLIEERLALERNFLAFTSGLLIAVVLVPMKGRIESVLEMLLYRDTYRHRRAILDFAKELGTFHDLQELIEIIRDRLSAAVNLQQMNLYVREGSDFILYRRDGRIPSVVQRDALPDLHADRPTSLDSPRLPESSELPGTLLLAGYRYLFPLRHREELQGMLLCGNKGGDEPLSRDDLQLISSITAPLALAIENARLYGRLRRQLEEIRSLKEYNENIIESSSSAIVVVAADGTVLTANKAFWDLVGVGPESEERIDRLFPPYRMLGEPGGTAVEHHFVNRRGEEKDLAVTASPFNATDAPAGTTVLVIGDVSDRVRLERELQEKDRLAALGLLAAGVAHEVNTPLTGISSYAQLLLADTSPDDPRYALLKKMEQQTFRASHLVNNLLDFAARRGPNEDHSALNEVVRSTLALHEDLLDMKSISIHTSLAGGDLVVRGGVHELQQVLTNLLLNARDAVGKGGNIWIRSDLDGDQVILSVRDDGCGIPPDLQSRIFQPLVTTKRGQGGTGLGLAISQRLVESIGGTIEVESDPGNGATFSVRLPLSASTQ
ncbi:MAG TPA: ATP-binding protein [Thermoanaerobaculia bacterium]|nr:ATP-binding protein [Thermoanaerobaculia bacterium]